MASFGSESPEGASQAKNVQIDLQFLDDSDSETCPGLNKLVTEMIQWVLSEDGQANPTNAPETPSSQVEFNGTTPQLPNSANSYRHWQYSQVVDALHQPGVMDSQWQGAHPGMMEVPWQGVPPGMLDPTWQNVQSAPNYNLQGYEGAYGFTGWNPGATSYGNLPAPTAAQIWDSWEPNRTQYGMRKRPESPTSHSHASHGSQSKQPWTTPLSLSLKPGMWTVTSPLTPREPTPSSWTRSQPMQMPPPVMWPQRVIFVRPNNPGMSVPRVRPFYHRTAGPPGRPMYQLRNLPQNMPSDPTQRHMMTPQEQLALQQMQAYESAILLPTMPFPNEYLSPDQENMLPNDIQIYPEYDFRPTPPSPTYSGPNGCRCSYHRRRELTDALKD